MRRFLHLLGGPALLLLPRAAWALENRFVFVPGLRIGFAQLMNNIISFLAVTSVSVCTVLFLAGAYMMVLNAYDENRVKTGKDLMQGALIGLVVVLGSYGILRTVFYVIYS